MLPSLIQALQSPDCYPHPVTLPIKVIETQVSWVLLTGDYAYKIKKELNFGFLDFSTLDKRLYYCEEELRLNQRLAPDIYQSVVTISGALNNPLVSSELLLAAETCAAQVNIKPPTANNKVLEYAVRMCQFDPAAGLDKLLKENKFEPEWIDQLAEQLAHFHQTLPTVTSNSPWGEANNIWQLVADNYLHTLDYCDDQDDLEQLTKLYTQTTEQFAALKQTFLDRRKSGFIRECHGDLHLGNVTLFQGKLRLFDCIEFNLQFRWIDTCSDLAFLLMDLEANQKSAWANLALNRYLELSGDYQSLQLLNFYKSFRSMVRAKVATLGLQACHHTFKKYLRLTQSYQQKNQPILILMHGLSGSGKSYLSRIIIENIACIRIRSETERARLHRELLKKGKKLELHSPEINARLSQHLLTLTETILGMGYNVVVDGTFLKQHFRQKYINVADRMNITMHIVSCNCENKLLKARLVRGITRSNGSNFSLERLSLQLLYQQPLCSTQQKLQLLVNTDDDQGIQDFIIQIKQLASPATVSSDV
ncbi:MAG: AAA family ATPase [Oceanospirillaceae bacterium]|nr:AAA family ATPase [Oceanospirillaceae bacterium]